MTETKAPEGYSLDSTPIRFDVIGGASAPASATFENAALPTDPVTPTNPSPPVALATPDEPAGDGGSPQVLASTGDGVVGIGCLAAIAVICATFLCVVAKRKAHVAGIEP